MHVPSEHNFKVDILSKLGSSNKIGYNRTITQYTLFIPSVEASETKNVDVSLSASWMTPIIYYLQYDELPQDELEAKKIRKRVESIF